MFAGYEDMQKMGRENFDNAMQNFGSVSKNVQAMAAEFVDYQKKAFEDGSAAMEKMMGAKSIDKAMEVQADYAKSAYEGYVGQMTKVGEMYADFAKDAYKPFETMVAKAGK